MERLSAVGLQRQFQVADAVIYTACLHQKHAQMMVGCGVTGLSADQGAIGIFRRGKASGAMVRQRCGNRCIPGWLGLG